MRNDKITLKDLSFLGGGEASIFQLLDRTVTAVGREQLRRYILRPPDTFDALQSQQECIRFFASHPEAWDSNILNGTIVLLEKFFESADNASAPPSAFSLAISAWFQKLLSKGAYSFSQFSLSHLRDFINGCQQLVSIKESFSVPPRLQKILEEMESHLHQSTLMREISETDKKTNYKDLARLIYEARRLLKHPIHHLIRAYEQLDAWHALALATVEHNWTFPQICPSYPLVFNAHHLYHPLLSTPVAYDIALNEQQNFLLLTGANMSGKTTFMRAIGVAAVLAHMGCGVPAHSLTISFLEGVITNIQVEDNILAGESYFFAEVQRIKQTAIKMQQPLPHLVLMDELFKGTNVHDAYECTRVVVSGLLHQRRHLMVLSTHLYEVAQQFRDYPEILFSYFETQMSDEGSYAFTYHLLPGISNDRIGYRILQKEGVIELLNGRGRDGVSAPATPYC